ncbi:MAG: hypothetical protein IJ703_06665 [Eubacterium sp.]|nr:hypothetical protein [Eubacterium sp.]
MNKKSKILIAIVIFIILAILLGFAIASRAIKENKYKKATKLLEEDKYKEAAELFDELGDYSDSSEMYMECFYQLLDDHLESGNYMEGIEMLEEMPKHSENDKEIERRVGNLWYEEGRKLYEERKLEEAVKALENVSGSSSIAAEDLKEKINKEIKLNKAIAERKEKEEQQEAKNKKKYDEAMELLNGSDRKIIEAYSILRGIIDYKDARDIMKNNVDEYYEDKNYSAAVKYYIKADGKVEGIEERYKEADNYATYERAIDSLTKGDIDTGLNLLNCLDDWFENVSTLKWAAKKAQDYKRKWYLYKYTIEDTSRGRVTDNTYSEFGAKRQISVYVERDGRIRISMYGGSTYTDESSVVTWDISGGYCCFDVDTGLEETYYLHKSGKVSSIYRRYFMHLDEGETLDPDLNPGIAVVIEPGRGGGSGGGSSGGSSSGSGKDKETTTEFDPDDHDIEMYYLDYQDEFEDYDDAYDDFLDNPEYWDDY